MPWLQNYDPLHNVTLSATVAALPIVLFSAIGVFRVRLHFAALVGPAVALAITSWLRQLP